MNGAPLPVLLYDGTCGLCNRVVLFLLRHDRRNQLHFAPLQGEPAQHFLRSHGLPTADFSTLVFVRDWHDPRSPWLVRTDGALAAVAELGPPWSRLAILRLIPRFLRDSAYTLVARTRYAIFGRHQPKALSDPQWERRFLAP